MQLRKIVWLVLFFLIVCGAETTCSHQKTIVVEFSIVSNTFKVKKVYKGNAAQTQKALKDVNKGSILKLAHLTKASGVMYVNTDKKLNPKNELVKKFFEKVKPGAYYYFWVYGNELDLDGERIKIDRGMNRGHRLH